MTSSAHEQRERLKLVGKALRNSVATPTDTYITEDMPLLLTLLSRVPARRKDEGSDN